MRSEAELIKAVANGDTQAFSVLYDQYSEKVYNTALSYSKRVEDAEEITQDVFVKIHKSAAKFKGGSTLNTWVYRIAVNTSLNHLKRRNSFILFKNTLTTYQSNDFEHPAVLDNKENAKALYKAIDCLPSNQKTAFILSYIEEVPRQEVADIMGNSLKAVESLLQRAKKNMRSELEKIYPHRRKSKK